MARILSHPFRLDGDAVATVDQVSEGANAEQIAVLVSTIRGERQMVPSFGITDPAFHRVDPAEVVLGVAMFGPPVSITDIEQTDVSDTTQSLVVRYE